MRVIGDGRCTDECCADVRRAITLFREYALTPERTEKGTGRVELCPGLAKLIVANGCDSFF